jgi:hypothetical protein
VVIRIKILTLLNLGSSVSTPMRCEKDLIPNPGSNACEIQAAQAPLLNKSDFVLRG